MIKIAIGALQSCGFRFGRSVARQRPGSTDMHIRERLETVPVSVTYGNDPRDVRRDPIFQVSGKPAAPGFSGKSKEPNRCPNRVHV